MEAPYHDSGYLGFFSQFPGYRRFVPQGTSVPRPAFRPPVKDAEGAPRYWRRAEVTRSVPSAARVTVAETLRPAACWNHVAAEIGLPFW